MEVFAAISLAGNVVGFVDFASKLIAQTMEIYNSASGVSQDNRDISILIADLSLHATKLKQDNSSPATSETEHRLQSLATRCAALAAEIAEKLKKLSVDEISEIPESSTIVENTKHRSFRSFGKVLQHVRGKKAPGETSKGRSLKSLGKALRSAWEKKDLDEKMAKLSGFRSELQFGIFVSFVEKFNLDSLRWSDQFGRLDDQGKQLIGSLVQVKAALEQSSAAQKTFTGELLLTTETNIKDHLNQNQAQLLQVMIDLRIEGQQQDNLRRENIILSHLAFPTMNKRSEEIDPAHAETFNWIFEGYKLPDSEILIKDFANWLKGKDTVDNLKSDFF
ncbi:hypothetical protein VTL71DRAFT_8077 [Oculimacula yallundae]|uniref:NACHT-NTPase and P-loop NTPases N-terminal domain-containing protein n=1 Tax=Oculimacula yallundae TaxID=86028 RepID=A0ABR4CZ03_9HELO